MQFQFTTVKAALGKSLPPKAQKIITFLSKTKRGQLIDITGVANTVDVHTHHVFVLLKTTSLREYYRKVNGRGWFGSLATIKLLDKENNAQR